MANENLFNMRVILFITLFLFSLNPNMVRPQADSTASNMHGLEPGEYSVGFQLLEKQDYSRSVSGGDSRIKVYRRPVRIYLWYPANVPADVHPIRFGRYASLANEDIWPVEITGILREQLEFSRRVLARSLGVDAYKALLQKPVLAFEGAEALEGPFPLIVMAQGLYYESPVTFAAMGEYLAGRGFVVATCPLVGTNSPIVRMNMQDLETQVRDLEFVVAIARRNPFVSQDKLGVFGFDMGGMAGLIFSMRNADVDAFVSVSSDILYENPSGIPQASPDYDPLRLNVPWLHSVPASWLKQPADSNSKSLFETAVHSNRYLLLTDGMGHVDYTSYALIDGRRAMVGYWTDSTPKVVESHKAISLYISNFFSAFLSQDSRGLAFLTQDPQKIAPVPKMTLEHRAPIPDLITYEQFVQAVIAGQAEQAIRKVLALRESHPNHYLLQDANLERLIWSLRDTWGFTERVMPVIKLRAKLYPLSDSAQQMLAEGYIAQKSYPKAIEVYSKLLERNPSSSRIKARLEWLYRR